VLNSYEIKLSRDAELYLEDDYRNAALVEKIYQSLEKRETGQPTRLLFDSAMPEDLQQALMQKLGIGEVDMFPGGRYHNLSDFFDFSDPANNPKLKYRHQPALPHPVLSYSEDMLAAIREKDQLIHFPYQQFSVVEKFIETAASDPGVISRKITLYRIAETSQLTDALVSALEKGKKVTIFVEAKARFDEKNNIEWGQTFIDHGATVIFSVPNIKVHSKVALITRTENGKIQRYAYIGTGNFNAKTATIYCDHGIFTGHPEITGDLEQVFLVLQKKLIIPKLRYILASPYNTRSAFMEMIEKEIRNAKNGLPSGIILKMNSLEDSRMIEALHRASDAGVSIDLLVRGFCSLVPDDAESDNSSVSPIRIISIIDRYLEHGRLYLFVNGGDEKLFMGSADWMTRNLDRRIEVLVPILDPDLFRELREILMIQFQDNVKARTVDASDSNTRVPRSEGELPIRSQYALYTYLKEQVLHENR
jgi:polyphosphate kinase